MSYIANIIYMHNIYQCISICTIYTIYIRTPRDEALFHQLCCPYSHRGSLLKLKFKVPFLQVCLY